MRAILVLCLLLAGTAATPGAGAAPPLPEQHVVRTFGPADGLAAGAVLAIVQDRRGYLWVETDGGTHRFDGLRFQRVDAELPELRPAVEDVSGPLPSLDELAGRDVLSRALDHEGTHWIGTDQGLLSLRRNPFTHFGRAEGLADDWVFTVYQDQTDALWVGGAGGLDRLASDASVTHYSAADGVPVGTLWPVGEDPQGRLLVSTAPRTLVYDATGFRESELPGGVSSILNASSGELWAGTHAQGLVRLGETRRFYTTRDGLAADAVYSLAEGADGEVWIGTSSGLSRFHDESLTSLGLGENLATDLISSLYADPRGNLWIGTLSSGLVLYRRGAFAAFSGDGGLDLFTVHQVVDDLRGSLWLSSNKGIYRVGVEALLSFADGEKPTLPFRVYTEADGLRFGDGSGGAQPVGLRDRTGRLWFCTAGGLVTLDPSATENDVAPPVVIEMVSVDGHRVEARSSLRLPPGTRRLQVDYAGFSFRAAGSTRFRYRLEGYDADWIEAGTERHAVYTNLAPGAYRFRVLAANDSGVWSDEGAVFALVQAPRLHQHRTFQAFCAVLVLLGAAGFHRLRLRSQLRRNRELTRLRDELLARSRDIAAKNAEIEALTLHISNDVEASITVLQDALERAERNAEQSLEPRGDGVLQREVAQMRSAAGEIDVLFDKLLHLADNSDNTSSRAQGREVK